MTHSVAFTTDVVTADGATHPFARRERPHLLFDADGTTPIVLYTTLTNWTVGVLGTDKAFTFAQKIDLTPPPGTGRAPTPVDV